MRKFATFIYDMCCENDFFTGGDSTAYEKMLRYSNSPDMDLRELAAMIYMVSDASYDDVYRAVVKARRVFKEVNNKVDPNLITSKYGEDRYFLPGNGKDVFSQSPKKGPDAFAVRVYLNDAHTETEDGTDFDQFEIDYIPARLIIDAKVLDDAGAVEFNDWINDGLKNFCARNDAEGSAFRDIFDAYPDGVSLTRQELISWAISTYYGVRLGEEVQA